MCEFVSKVCSNILRVEAFLEPQNFCCIILMVTQTHMGSRFYCDSDNDSVSLSVGAQLFASPWVSACHAPLGNPWDFPGKNTGVGCHSLLQGIFLTQGWNLGLLHCRQILYRLSYKGSPRFYYIYSC